MRFTATIGGVSLSTIDDVIVGETSMDSAGDSCMVSVRSGVVRVWSVCDACFEVGGATLCFGFIPAWVFLALVLDFGGGTPYGAWRPLFFLSSDLPPSGLALLFGG